MSLIYKHVAKPYAKKLNELDKSTGVNPIFKHLLKCTSCLWNITFYESTGYVPVNSKRIHCPVCKEKDMNSVKIKIIS